MTEHTPYTIQQDPARTPAAWLAADPRQLNGEAADVRWLDPRRLEEVPALRNIRNRTLVLARPSAIRGQTFRVALGWAEGTGTVYVAVSHVEGEILLEPPEPEVEEPEPGEGDVPASDSVLTDQINYLYAQPPERLGLEGETMENYRIYYASGMAMIDGQNCHRFHVYARRQEDTNGILGIYYLSADNESLYQLDIEADEVTRLP